MLLVLVAAVDVDVLHLSSTEEHIDDAGEEAEPAVVMRGKRLNADIIAWLAYR